MTLRWHNDYNEFARWDHMMANTIELFGLPGDRYVTHVTEEQMIFWFRDHRDALLFKLCHGHSELCSA
jgi:hypothetical protein